MALKVMLDGSLHEVEIVRRRPHLVLRIEGREHEIVRLPESGDGQHLMEVDASTIDFARVTLGDRQVVRLNGRTAEIAVLNPLTIADDAAVDQDVLRAPMPGAVVSVHCQVGGVIRRGETIVTIESMKLQSALPAPRDGMVAEVLRTEGQTFDKNDVLVVLAPIAEEN
ncbi:biotin/lipoyl-containing protein [Arvimicrobium flavum]|uniref:biotin/lipoyl-containing protein n=1 Tax=Arvimicrobium flavum TaxID=3393320 RepID=UPI00237AC94C|nr:biotin/lipoyl-containing protein [Mesorhizobium shangrilense]